MKRSCGILLPVSSLPSPYGIGAFGRAAYRFVDFLARSGQSWWQILPLTPTSYGDSPYQSFSTFAGNPYFVDLETLRKEGLLTAAELAGSWGEDPGRVDYALVYRRRFSVLQKAVDRLWQREPEALDAFCRENGGWLDNYALFMALKRRFGMRAWTEWEEEDVRLHRPEAVARYTRELQGDIRLFQGIQYLFFRQWDALRAYAKTKGVGIIGDLPIYVAMDSADVWAEPRFFQLDRDNVPTAVAGVPPDAFTADGQLWGNPLYNWDEMKKDGYGWWIRRVAGAARLYDAIRIDHFRGFESYWAVPYGSATAKNGAWVKGPGLELVQILTGWFRDVQFIAEDLGYLTPEVRDMLARSGLPGMKVLEFSLGSGPTNEYLPHNHVKNSLCYIGTHDNAPLAGWWRASTPAERRQARDYLGLNKTEGPLWGILRAGLSSVSDVFVAQLQDYLMLGDEARINVPGTPAGNWQWRLDPAALTPALSRKLRTLARRYDRDRQENG